MKRLIKNFSIICLICAAMISLMIGANLHRIHNFSANMVAQTFPVNYKIEYRNSISPSISVAPVQFVNEAAIITSAVGNKIIPITDAVFICQETSLLAKNTLRSGLLSAFIIFAVACLPIALTVISFSLHSKKSRFNTTKCRSRSADHYTTDSARNSKHIPNVA